MPIDIHPKVRPSDRPAGRRRGVHVAAAAWACLVIGLLLTPGAVVLGVTGGLSAEGSHLDKLVHAVLFGVLAWLAARSFSAAGLPRPRLLALLAAAALGGAIELVQPLVARDRDLWDAIANATGAVVATLLQRI